MPRRRSIFRPASTNVADLIGWLSQRDEGYAAAFAEPTVIRAALDREHVEHDDRDCRRARGGVLPADDGRLVSPPLAARTGACYTSTSEALEPEHPRAAREFRSRAKNRAG